MGIRFFQLKYVANLKQVGHGKRRIDKSVFNLYLIDSWVTSQSGAGRKTLVPLISG